jgi:hypothetical protein
VIRATLVVLVAAVLAARALLQVDLLPQIRAVMAVLAQV